MPVVSICCVPLGDRYEFGESKDKGFFTLHQVIDPDRPAINIPLLFITYGEHGAFNIHLMESNPINNMEDEHNAPPNIDILIQNGEDHTIVINSMEVEHTRIIDEFGNACVITINIECVNMTIVFTLDSNGIVSCTINGDNIDITDGSYSTNPIVNGVELITDIRSAIYTEESDDE